jgi:hypothetical protein
MMRLLNSDGSDKWNLTGIQYQVALRCIGQDLTPLVIESLEITLEDRDFVAQGLRIVAATGQGGSAQQPSREAFTRRYAPEEIKRLDELSASQKTGVQSTPDAVSLSESLRTVGRMVDSKKGRLIKLSKEQSKITFAYEDENGQAHREDLYSLSVYKGQQEGLSERGTNAEDVWDEPATDTSLKNRKPNLKLK